jgi:2-polyprenyl-3-methyl-5-hydroxy-6-metoxy-1,4-benzoquinol methylase
MEKYVSSVTHNLYRDLQDNNLKSNSRDYFSPTETEELYNETGRVNAESLIKEYKFRTGNKKIDSILEYGCGDGRVAQYTAKECKHMTCLDITPAVLKKAEERLINSGITNAIYQIGDEYQGSETVDFIYCLQVLQHNNEEDQFLILNKIKEALKSTGLACIHFPKFENRIGGYINHATCMCFTYEQVEFLVSPFSEYEIVTQAFYSSIHDANVIEDYFVWVKK